MQRLPAPWCVVKLNMFALARKPLTRPTGWEMLSRAWPGPGWKCGRNHDQVLSVCTGRRMAQPQADRRLLRLRAMPPGRLRRKWQNPHHADRHNDGAGPCGCVHRLRDEVVGGTEGQRSSMTGHPILDGTIHGLRDTAPVPAIVVTVPVESTGRDLAPTSRGDMQSSA